MPLNLGELEQALRGLSHSEEAIRTVQTFSEDLNGTQARIDTWNATNALVRTVIDQSEAAARGFNTPDDEFFILQGDIVRTESAFLYGERITGAAKFIILNSSCDLVPGRSQHAALLRIIPIRRGDDRVKDKLGILLKFRRRDSMYLPPLPGDDDDVLGNVIEFQGICQIEGTNLQLAERVASLSLLGWRIFASLARAVVARSNPREVEIREAMEK